MKKLATVLLLSFLMTACNSTSTTTETATNTATSTDSNTTVADFCTDTATPAVHLPSGDVQNLAKTDKENGEAYAFAESKGADIIPVDDGNSFVVWWQPEGFDITKDTVVVSLHGHGSFATRDFEVWYPELTQRNVAYLGIQWWFGRSLENEGYYEPDQIYKIIAEELKAKGVPAGHVIFEGFSMGSARSYTVSLYDKTCGNNYFGVNISNSGQWEDGYPLHTDLLAGTYGDKPFEGTHWILFCGEKDNNEEAHGGRSVNTCEGMDHTQEVLTNFGASVDLLLKDPDGDHGAFMMNADNVNQALDKAEKILEAQ